ncbi:MAG: MBL fold metallo-hydrolase [Nitrospiraceae bacterium]|nr:MAG: MBL fold metallo-hydrolase [Nitrospiraceae bacterium]
MELLYLRMGVVSNHGAAFLLTIIPLFLSGCIPTGSEIKTSPHSSVRKEIIIHFIDVGQGDSTFIQLDNGDSVLIDAGSPAGGMEVVRYLKDQGVKEIGHLIFTHAHNDHIGGISGVPSSLDVLNYYDNGLSNFSSDLFVDYLTAIRENPVNYHVLQAGDVLHAGNAVIEVLNPALPPAGNINEDSIVLRLSFGDMRILFAGDMAERGEKRLLDMGTELASAILRVGHHGENDASSEQFLKSVRPEAAVISVGAHNEYGRPHPDLLDRLEKAMVQVYRTDRDGSIVLRTDGLSYSIRTEREGPLTIPAPAAEAEGAP